jgi:hypothetical protein
LVRVRNDADESHWMMTVDPWRNSKSLALVAWLAP